MAAATDLERAPCVAPVELLRRDPDGRESRVWTPCKSRRRSRCAPCSARHEADTFHLIWDRLRDPRPFQFVTLTAPGADVFGTWHHKAGNCHRVRRCRTCGESVWCGKVHREGDPLLGAPVHSRCFDYRAAVLWNRYAPRLWTETIREANRVLRKRHRDAGRRDPAPRLIVSRTVEFQRRGLVHAHALVEGAPLSADQWRAIAHAVKVKTDRAVLPEVAWGRQGLKVQTIAGQDGPRRSGAARYVAKYVTKGPADWDAQAAEGGPWADHHRKLQWWAGVVGESIDLEDDARDRQAPARELRRVAAFTPPDPRRPWDRIDRATGEVAADHPRPAPAGARSVPLVAVGARRRNPGWARSARESYGFRGHVFTKSHTWGTYRARRAAYIENLRARGVIPPPRTGDTWRFLGVVDPSDPERAPPGPVDPWRERHAYPGRGFATDLIPRL